MKAGMKFLLGATVIVGGTQACYRPSTDTIHMPDEARFFDTDGRTRAEAFAAVEFHELVVKPQEVVPGQAESADGWHFAEASMRPVPIVAMQPWCESVPSLS